MEPKKISFGFSKRTKTTNITSNNFLKEDKKLELIECLEGQSIKVKDAIEEIVQPLIIPLKDNQKNLLDRIRAAKNRDKLQEKKDEPEDSRADSELTPDELAARQLIKEAKNRLATGYSSKDTKVSVLPINEDIQSQEGEKEPTLEDYESVPISDYGLALLRGMGWKEGMSIGKNTSKLASVSTVPELRPKGLGLGATKVIKSEIPVNKAVDRDGNELILVKGCCAKVIAGPYKGNYCEVQGFDEEAGRVIIKVYPRGEIVNINELLLLPVTKDDFSKGSKVLNNAKYEEYKEKSDKKLENYKLKSGSSDLQPTIISDSEDDKNERSRSQKNSDYRQKDMKQHHSRSKNNDKTKQYKTKRDNSASSSSNDEKFGNNSHSKYNKEYSSDEDYYETDKKSKKHTKSKNRDRSRSKERYSKNKKHSRHRDSSDDDKKEKRKKNKCKSRHRRNSSSSSEDRRYKSKR